MVVCNLQRYIHIEDKQQTTTTKVTMHIWYKYKDDATVPFPYEGENQIGFLVRALLDDRKTGISGRAGEIAIFPHGVETTTRDKALDGYKSIPNTTYNEPLFVKVFATQQRLDLKSVVGDKLKNWDGTAPRLPEFKISEDAAFRCYWIRGNKIPANPMNEKRASLLLYDLEESNFEGGDGYKYIQESQGIGPISLYGTSGAGKTRTIFEYLSQNYGIYLNAHADDLQNPGSRDVSFLLDEVKLERIPEALLKGGKTNSNGYDSKVYSQSNLKSVKAALNLLVAIRLAVFDHVDAVLKSNRDERGLTCYEWLLIQLFPIQFLGCDVFRVIMELFNLNETVQRYRPAFRGTMSCFVDEAQVLARTFDKAFFVSSDGTENRSVYYAFLKGLVGMKGEELHYPCFSGTGLSFEDFKAEAKALINKRTFKDHSFFFFGLKNLTTSDVTEYMKKFLKLDEVVHGDDLVKVGDDLVKHVGGWLKGRPRWVATFIEEYLERSLTKSSRQPRGKFKVVEIPLIKSLNAYIEVCTESPKRRDNQEERRLSWTLGERSAGKAIYNMFQKKGEDWATAQREFRKLSFEFSLNGVKVNMTKKSVDMIEAGVASVSTNTKEKMANDSKFIQAYIFEPIIVQASLEFFGLQNYTEEKLVEAGSEVEKGIVFEQYLLPSIQDRFKTILEGQHGKSHFKDYNVPSSSSYGVLARKCDNPNDTITWINDIIECRFEGSIPPFCFPDTKLGPDLLFLLRHINWHLFLLAATQAKLRNDLNEVDALRTIVPELFFKENRSTQKSCALANNKNLQGEWKKVENKLFCMEETEEEEKKPITRVNKNKTSKVKKRKRDMIRVLVQYPNEASVNPGLVPPSQYKPQPGGSNCGLQDHLVTVDESNANNFFGSAGAAVLRFVKPSKKKKTKSKPVS